MEIKVNLKSLGKRRQSVKTVTYEIPGHPKTLRELICAVTQAGVEEYNRCLETPELLRCLTSEEIADMAQSGKVSFGVNYGEKKADLMKAQENAIQCFEDGIYRIFLNETPLEALEERVQITEESIFTFVRLTMLAGRMW